MINQERYKVVFSTVDMRGIKSVGEFECESDDDDEIYTFAFIAVLKFLSDGQRAEDDFSGLKSLKSIELDVYPLRGLDLS